MPCLLHTLPPELREVIIKPLLVDWTGKTPNLIKAFRPNKQLYNEALAIFYKFNIFTFHKGNFWSFGDMTKEAVLSLERVRICVEPKIMKKGLWKVGVSRDEESFLAHIRPASTSISTVSLADATNIRVVIVEYKSEDVVTYATFPPFIGFGSMAYSSNYFLIAFQTLRRVELILSRPYWNGDPSLANLYYNYEMRYGEGIRLANERLGVSGKLSRVPALHFEDGDPTAEDLWEAANLREEWFWQAERGTFLKPPRPPCYTRMLDTV